MKKLKLFIVLACLPAVLTACGKSDSEKGADKANARIAQAAVYREKINKAVVAHSSPSQYSDAELSELKADCQAFIALMSEAIRIDDKDSSVVWADRDKAGQQVAAAKEILAETEKEIARRAAAKVTTEKAS